MTERKYTLPGEALKDAQAFLAHSKDKGYRFIDLRFTDLFGTWHHKTYTLEHLLRNKGALEKGLGFDGSSIRGWKHIDMSDMLLKPDLASARVDPFGQSEESDTVAIICDIYDPLTNKPYERDPRSLAKRAEDHLKQTGFADEAIFGPEPEFFLLDSIDAAADGTITIRAEEEPGSALGHYAGKKSGYFPTPPIDRTQGIRAEIARTLEELGCEVEGHHHEVARAGQGEVIMNAAPLVEMADRLQWFKYVVKMVAHQHGKIATFMPKVIPDDNGSGMHVHQSLRKNGKTVFAGEGYAGLSELAECYTGGILRHGPALRALCSPTTNSDQRLVPGFEAPTYLAYARGNRSAAVRIPVASSASAKRIEVRFPDPSANPYIAFSALLMAGLDGVKQGFSPGEPAEFDIYDDKEKTQDIPQLPETIEKAWIALQEDHAWLDTVMPEETRSALHDTRATEIKSVRKATKRLKREIELYLSC